MEPELHKAPSRFYEIDLLRFLAALAVLIFHYTYRAWAEHDFSPVRYPELGRVTRYGFLGVQLFFIISGYVVLLSAHGKTVQQFFISRVKRLYPAFWVACPLTFVVVRLWGPVPGTVGWSTSLDVNIRELVLNLTMLHSFMGIEDLDSSYWSLAPEICFYFLITLVISWNLYHSLPWMLALWLAYSAFSGPTSGMFAFTYLFQPTHAPFFVAGMVFYMLQNNWFNRWTLYGLLVGAFLLALRSVRAEIAGLHIFFRDPNFSFTVAAAAVTLFFGVFLLIINRVINFERYTWLGHLGALTYPLYLVHGSIGFVIYQRVGDRLDKYVLFGLLVLLMLSLAYAIHLIEKRYSKLLGDQTAKLLAYLSGKKDLQPTVASLNR
ncbi:acyltransferase [Hymenobacter sp. BT664]|uniref:Acyltransferase n=1 Tax=Hymenobacter montanus TaxID=2771359 RepID=A0A927BG91_9BACT|nr:acyltransferase [Hymenobacter montanus]MBD2770346.1 acyltransferase [Hymenobacter montanus]